MKRLVTGFFTQKWGRNTYLALLALFVVWLTVSFQPSEHGMVGLANLYPYELRGYDLLQTKVLRIKRFDPSILLVGIDDASLQMYGQWPWPRALHGQLVDRVSKAGAAAIVFDILFAEPSSLGSADDDALAASIKSAAQNSRGGGSSDKGGFPFVVLGNKLGALVSEQNTPELSQELAAERADALDKLTAAAVEGFMDADSSLSSVAADGSMRKASLVRWARGPAAGGGREGWQPSLDLAAFALYKGVDLGSIRYGPDSITVGDVVIPTNSQHEINIEYFHSEEGTSQDSLAPIPYARMLTGALPPDFPGSHVMLGDDQIKGHVVLVGPTTPGLGDVTSTPVGSMCGVFVHAQILNQLIQRKWVRDTPQWLYIGMMTLLPALVVVLMTRLGGLATVLMIVGPVLLLWEGSLFLMAHGWWLPPIGPIVTTFIAASAFALYQFLRGHYLLRQYITPELARDLLMAGGEAARTSEVECTVIFSDIRGFTTLNESMSPSKMVALLKEYHSLTVPIYEKHGGRCLDYLGDAQMVVYGDPMTQKRAREKNHAVAAMRAAVEAHEAIEEMNARWQAKGDPPFEVGIGACSGVVALGVLGADSAHLQYTVIGDVTNTAARVQGLSRDLSAPVIAAESTIATGGDRILAEKLKSVALKGKAKEVTVYRVLGIRDDPVTAYRMRTKVESLTPLLLACLVGAALMAGGCGGSAPSATSPSAPPVVQASASTATRSGPEATIMPVGTPIVVQRVQPTRPSPTASGTVPSSSPQAAAPIVGPRVTYATPPGGAALPDGGLPIQRSTPAAGGSAVTSSTVGVSPMDGMTLPIYPNASKKTQVTQPIPGAKQLILVIVSSDSMDVIKKWYETNMDHIAVVDRGAHDGPDRKVEISRQGTDMSDPKMVDTVVLQRLDNGTIQIILSCWQKG